MNCLRVTQEIKAYIDGELRPWTRWLVARHIASCAECRREMEEMNELTNDVRTATNVTAPQGLKDKVLGGFTFQPAGHPQRTNSVMRGLGVAAGGMVAVVVLGALIMPMFSKARESAHMPQGSQRSLPAMVTQPLAKMADGGVRYKMRRQADDGFAYQAKPGGRTDQSRPPSRALSDSAASTPAKLLIIKTADLSVLVRDFQQANDEAVFIAKSVGGYVTDTSAESDRGVPTSGSLSMRVPAGSFERTLNRLAKLGKVTSRSINGEDVTGESVDLDSRLRNLRAEERQYLDIMNRAKRIPDVVTVTGELSRVRGEIEEAQGRLKYLKSAAAMSTINLSVSEKAKTQPHKSSIESTFGNAIASLGGTLSNLASLVIWLLVYSPFWALPIALWLCARKRAAVVS